MNRREAVQYISILLGGTLTGMEGILSGCTPDRKEGLFTKGDLLLLDEIAETILPKTSTPGAKEAGVGNFMSVMVSECYSEKEQQAFISGMKDIDARSEKRYGQSFLHAQPTQRQELLTELDREQKNFSDKKKPEEPPHYFRLMKELTLLGYFTSEAGCTQAKRYVPVPGKFEGCIPYKKGEKAYS